MGILLLAIQAFMIVAFVVGLARRKGNPEGISLMTQTTWIVIGMGWLIYGIAVDSIVVLISGILGMTGSAVETALIWKHTKGHRLYPVNILADVLK